MNTAISREKYARLLADRLPCVIDSEEDHAKVLADVQELMVRGDGLSPEESALLQLMILLLQDYESKCFSMDAAAVTPLEMLEHLMEAHGNTAKDLWDVIGDKGTMSKILSGERKISKGQAKRLGEFYAVSAALFI